MKKLLKRVLCRIKGHDYKHIDSTVVGVCLSWAFTPARQFRFGYKCAKCGGMDYKTGYIPGDKQLNPELYNDGWPIDIKGRPLKMADETMSGTPIPNPKEVR